MQRQQPYIPVNVNDDVGTNLAGVNAQFQAALLQLLWNEVQFHYMLLAEAEKKRSRFWSARPIRRALEVNKRFEISPDFKNPSKKAVRLKYEAKELSNYDTQYQFFLNKVSDLVQAVTLCQNSNEEGESSNPIDDVAAVISESTFPISDEPVDELKALADKLVKSYVRKEKIEKLEQQFATLESNNAPQLLAALSDSEARLDSTSSNGNKISKITSNPPSVKSAAVSNPDLTVAAVKNNGVKSSSSRTHSGQSNHSVPSVISAVAALYDFKSQQAENTPAYKEGLLSHLRRTGTTRSWGFGLFYSSEYKRVVKLLENAEQNPQTEEICAEALSRIDRLKQQKLAKEPENKDELEEKIQKIREAVQAIRRGLAERKIPGIADAESDFAKQERLQEQLNILKNQPQVHDTVGVMRVATTATSMIGLEWAKEAIQKHIPDCPFIFVSTPSGDDQLQMKNPTDSRAKVLDNIRGLSSFTTFYNLVLVIIAALFQASPQENEYAQLRALLEAVLSGQYSQKITQVEKNLRGTRFDWLKECRVVEKFTFPSPVEVVREVKKSLLGENGIFPCTVKVSGSDLYNQNTSNVSNSQAQNHTLRGFV